MRFARHELVSVNEPGYYHCMSRCVRRAFLCGDDGHSGRSFAHRKQWIEDRLLELSALFAIDVYAYAVMSNHVHVVVHVVPAFAARWSADEVASRWSRLFPVRFAGRVDESATLLKANTIASDDQRVAVCRERLSSLSWFMRCLNEPIARRANHEDACTGRFWEGRYKCQALPRRDGDTGLHGLRRPESDQVRIRDGSEFLSAYVDSPAFTESVQSPRSIAAGCRECGRRTVTEQ